MATSGVVFPEIKRQVEGISKFFNSDQEQTSSNDAKINGIYKTYWSMRNNGVPPEKISTEKYFHKRMNIMKFLVETEAGTGNFVRTNAVDIDGDGIGDPEVGVETVITPNFNAAASQIRNMNLDTPVPTELKTKIDTELTEGWNSKLVGTANLPKIKGEIAEAAHIISMSGVGTPEEHLEKAIEIIEKDYQVVTSSTGVKYAYKALNTDIDIGVNAGEIIPKYNELAAKSKEVKQWLKDFVPDLYDTNQYDLRFEPDEKNPNKIQLNVYDKEGRFKGQIGEKSATKRDMLGSQEQFNQFMATIKTQDRPVLTTTYTTPSDIVIGSALDTALYPETKEQPVADEFGNILSMINPKRKEMPKVLSTEGQVTPPSEGILKDIGDSIETAATYVLNSFGDPMIQNSEAIGALSTELSKALTDPLIEKINTFIAGERKKMQDVLGKQSTQDDKQSSLLDLLNPISTANASVLDESQVGEFTTSNIPSNQTTGEQVTIEGNTTEEKTANMIATQEGFSNTPYKDGKDRSVGYGFYLPALEADEKALIKDVNNVTKEEGAAVLRLKVQKIGNYLDKEIQGFRNIPEKAQSAIISMGYQLGVTNIPKTWKKFTAHIKEAAQYAEGSIEQANALLNANFEMLYNVAKDGTISLNKWATQTKKRAFEMAEAVIEDIDLPNLISSAEASTLETLKASDLPTPRPKDLKGTIINVLDEDKKSSNIIAAPYKALLSNIVGIEPNFNTEDIGEDTLSVINQATANAEARGSNSVEYDDYPLTKRGLKVGAIIANFKDISGKRLSSQERKQMEKDVNEVYPNNPIGLAMLAYDLATDPVLKAAGFVGGFSIQKDSEGNKFIKERWNFNNKSTSEGTIYKKMRGFFSKFAPITEDEGSEVFVKLASK
jgi:GH24 family phage-related lysozyme (muramidase)